MNRAGKQGVARQQTRGVADCMAVHTEGLAGRALKLCQLDQGVMVSTRQKAMASLNSAPTTTHAASQTELRWEHAATQVSGCRVCPALLPALDGSSEHTCGRCTQLEELLRLVTELREEVSRLQSIRECERERDYWNRTLPSLGQAQQADRMHEMEDSLSSLRLPEHSDLRGRGQRRQVPARHSRRVSSLTRPHPPRCPCTIGTRLCKWHRTITRTMVHLAWRCR